MQILVQLKKDGAQENLQREHRSSCTREPFVRKHRRKSYIKKLTLHKMVAALSSNMFVWRGPLDVGYVALCSSKRYL